MDVVESLSRLKTSRITCVDMHTSGEPTRIIISGYPTLTGTTLLEKRTQAQSQFDKIRTQIILEPRGHFDMYGALLVADTELVQAGQADIGVLFMTNDGYSTMCGHATIALGRFLIDTHDTTLFPRRNRLEHDPATNTCTFRLHVPCGVVQVTVPTTADGEASDPARAVSFVSVDSFATGLEVDVTIPEMLAGPPLNSCRTVLCDFAYGGAFFCLVQAKDLGFAHGLHGADLDDLSRATRMLKAAVNGNNQLAYLFQHPEDRELSFLYSVIVVDDDSRGQCETGICFFSDQQLDRSPTGSGVSARLAVAYARQNLKIGESRAYHSLLSRSLDPQLGFTGTIVSESVRQGSIYPAVTTKVEGFAYYTGYHTFVVESEDRLGEGGFVMSQFG